MNNVKVTISKDKKTATFEVDLTKRFGESQSGKTVEIAGTHGNQKLEGVDGISFGLTVYTKEGASGIPKEKREAAAK